MRCSYKIQSLEKLTVRNNMQINLLVSYVSAICETLRPADGYKYSTVSSPVPLMFKLGTSHIFLTVKYYYIDPLYSCVRLILHCTRMILLLLNIS